MGSIESVFRKDSRGGEAFQRAVTAEVFLAGNVDVGPVARSDADIAAGADAFDDEIGFEMYLNATAAQRDITFYFGDLKDGAFAGHVGGAVGAVCVLEVTFHRVHVGVGSLLKIGVERFLHAAEQSGGDGGGAKLAILDHIDPTGHPARSNEGLVRLGLVAGGALHGDVVQPNIRDEEAGEYVARGGFPRDAKQNGLIL